MHGEREREREREREGERESDEGEVDICELCVSVYLCEGRYVCLCV